MPSSAEPDVASPPHDGVVSGAGGVVFDRDGRVLVIRERRGGWVFPKGHIDPGESPLEAARREVAEEAGVDASCPEPEASWTTEYVNDRGTARAITWFRLVTDETEPTMREDGFPDGAFLAPAEALQQLAYREDRELLERVLASGRLSHGAAVSDGGQR